MLAQERALLEEHSYKFVLFDSADDVIKAKREGKLAVDFHFISYPGGTDIAMLEEFCKLGVRHIVCHSPRAVEGHNRIERDGGGLTSFGSELVEEMNRLGMIVDVSHSKYQTTMDIFGAYILNSTGGNPTLTSVGTNVTQRPMTGKNHSSATALQLRRGHGSQRTCLSS